MTSEMLLRGRRVVKTTNVTPGGGRLRLLEPGGPEAAQAGGYYCISCITVSLVM